MEVIQEQSAGDQMMEAPQAQPFVVCIRVVGDGTFEVGLESDESGEGAEASEDAPMRPARDVKEALTIALQIIKQGGKPAAAEFEAGYNETPER